MTTWRSACVTALWYLACVSFSLIFYGIVYFGVRAAGRLYGWWS